MNCETNIADTWNAGELENNGKETQWLHRSLKTTAKYSHTGHVADISQPTENTRRHRDQPTLHPAALPSVGSAVNEIWPSSQAVCGVCMEMWELLLIDRRMRKVGCLDFLCVTTINHSDVSQFTFDPHPPYCCTGHDSVVAIPASLRGWPGPANPL